MNALKLSRSSDLVYLVLTDRDEHVGNLKRINALWKFKAIGYDDRGDVIPGGGPLTHHHNMTFTEPDAVEVSARLSAP